MNEQHDDAVGDFSEFPDVFDMLSTASAVPAPFALRRRVLAGTKPVPVRTDAVQVYLDHVEALAALLDHSDAARWATTIADGMTLRDMVIHLSVVDELAIASVNGARQLSVDVEQDTLYAIAHAAGMSNAEIVSRWRSQASALHELGSRTLSDTDVAYLGLALTAEQVMIDRAFETWLHTQDIRKALGSPVVAPTSEALGLMIDLAARMLPLVLADVPRTTSVRLVATGDGAGLWLVPFGNDLAPSEPSATVTVDAMTFCLFVGNRLQLEDLPRDVTGDSTIAMQLLERAPRLARL